MLTTAAPAPMKEETLLPYTTKMAHCCNILLGMPLLNAPPPSLEKLNNFLSVLIHVHHAKRINFSKKIKCCSSFYLQINYINLLELKTKM